MSRGLSRRHPMMFETSYSTLSSFLQISRYWAAEWDRGYRLSKVENIEQLHNLRSKEVCNIANPGPFIGDQ
jgi:hypothetical protein